MADLMQKHSPCHHCLLLRDFHKAEADLTLQDKLETSLFVTNFHKDMADLTKLQYKFKKSGLHFHKGVADLTLQGKFEKSLLQTFIRTWWT